ncbi:MAG: DUF4290 domain-containing protein [Bacteroidales bacterium]|nr:DUF4290 domain-containing protein [Bacteroidales bacterium]
MEYNTTRDKLIIKEYGRNIHKMIEHAKTIEDKEKRTQYARMLISIMGQINPQAKEAGDYKHKLWDHLYMMTGFDLDVDAPYPPPSPHFMESKPKKISYKSNHIRYRHYGANIVKIIEAVAEMEDGAEKDALVMTIANHMKKSYLNWNRDSVNDELITDHLHELSGNRLEVKEEMQLHSTSNILSRNKKKKPSRPGQGQGQYQSSAGKFRKPRKSNYQG